MRNVWAGFTTNKGHSKRKNPNTKRRQLLAWILAKVRKGNASEDIPVFVEPDMT